jgi:ferritin-like protein/outer membrane lipoprotein SlyB
MDEKLEKLSKILIKLAADEYIAYNQYYLGALSAKGKHLNYLEKVFDTNGKDELDDHFNKLVDWMQSVGISPEFDYLEIDKKAGTKFVGIKDGTDTRSLVDLEITAEKEAIESYENALKDELVKSYPDLVTLLGEILIDERTHLRDLEDLKSSWDTDYSTKIATTLNFSRSRSAKQAAKIAAIGGATLGALLNAKRGVGASIAGAASGALLAAPAGAVGGFITGFGEDKDWSDDVDTKWTPPEGLFENGTAKEIAKAEKDGHKDLKSAMASLNFYINRAGKNLSKERLEVLEDAKDELRELYNSKENFSKLGDLKKLATILGGAYLGNVAGSVAGSIMIPGVGWTAPIVGTLAGGILGHKLNKKFKYEFSKKGKYSNKINSLLNF